MDVVMFTQANSAGKDRLLFFTSVKSRKTICTRQMARIIFGRIFLILAGVCQISNNIISHKQSNDL